MASCALALGACAKSPAAPATTTTFNPSALDAALGVVSGVSGTLTMQSLTALSPLLKVAPAPPSATPPAPTVACAPPVAGVSAVAVPRSPQATGLIADSLYRHLFVYDTATKAYAVTADTSGPASGIRFALYDVSTYGLPTVPLTTDGWLDLTDQSAGATLQLRSQINTGSSGVADYLVGLSGTQVADTAVLGGTATDGLHALAFHDSTTRAVVTGTVAYQVTVTAHVSDSTGGFSLDMYAARTNFDPFDYNDTLDFTFTGASQVIRMVGAISTYCLVPSVGLRIAVNGSAYATITNGTTTPNVTLVGGQPAPTDEAQAFLGMQTAQRQLFLWLGALYAPARALLP